MFDVLVRILSKDAVFISRGRKAQGHVKIQLACFLLRSGSMGATTMYPARQLGLGKGTVKAYCDRVTRALRNLSTHYIAWPSPERRLVISRSFKETSGLPHCISVGDASQMKFGEIPEDFGVRFLCRKKFPSVCNASISHNSRILM